MQAIRNPGSVRQTTGIIRDVDVAGRELTVSVYGTKQVFDVPTECFLLLHGEPVKLRLLLPGDYAQIAYWRAGDRLLACSIRVNWWLPLTGERRELREARAAARSARTASGVSRGHDQPASAGAGTPARARGVLIADGMGLIVVLLKLELEPLGFRVWLAQDSQEALALYRQHHEDIDVVLLDVQLPGGDGLQTLAALQQINPDVCSCFLTDGPARYTEEDLLERGAACVLTGPVRPAEVAQVVRQLIGEARAASARAGDDPAPLASRAR